MFDRMSFKGHLTGLYKQEAGRDTVIPVVPARAAHDFTAYAKGMTERIANNARKPATDAGRPVISFDHVKTRNRTQQPRG